jgi:transmembrane sensor
MSRAQQIEQSAALWVLRREEPGWSAADQAELDQWLAESDGHKVALWRLDCAWREADRISALGAPTFEPEPAAWQSWWKPLAIAASLVLALTMLLVQPSLFPDDPASQTASTQFETPIGGHRIVKLADGSRLELNTDTAVRVSVDKRTRAVWLERGEAFFDVAKRPGQAFVIHAGARTITVLGTKFSVRHTPRETVVAVLEGRVRLDDLPGSARDRHATVTAGDVAIAKARSTLVRNSAEAVEQQLAWRRGLLQFERTTLAAAAEQFNRYNHKQLVIADAEAARILVGGSFPAKDVDAFVRLLQQAYGIDVLDGAEQLLLSTRKLAHRGAPKALRSDMLQPQQKSAAVVPSSDCGGRRGSCALIPLSPPTPVASSTAPPEKPLDALREAKNWEILHKLYPPRALAAREEGLVGFTVKIDAGGNPTSCKISQSSGHPLLDLETCQLIMVHAVFKRPTSVTLSQQRSYEGVVNWKMPGSGPSPAAAAPKRVAEAAPAQELICRRVPRTGSNAAFERKCMTQSEWKRTSTDTRDTWHEIQGRGRRCEGYPAQCR